MTKKLSELTPEQAEKQRRVQRTYYASCNKEKKRAAYRRWYAANTDKARATDKRWKAANPDKVKLRAQRAHYRRRYGITLEERDAMFIAQGGACAACRADTTSSPWHVDHCHSTGKVRAILCDSCNKTLGHAKEDAARLRALANYIEAHQ